MKTEEKYLTEETAGGHGDKWEACAYDARQFLERIVPFAMEHSEVLQRIEDDPAFSQSDMIVAAVLYARGNETDYNGIVFPLARSIDMGSDSPNLSIVSSFPCFVEGVELVCEVEAVEYFPNTIEGRLWLSCCELPFSLCIFDTHFARYRTRYTNDGDYRFTVSALAYSLASTTDDKVVIDEPEEIIQHHATRAWVERYGHFNREKDLQAALDAYDLSDPEALEPVVFDLSRMTMLMPDDIYSDDATFSGEIMAVEHDATMLFGMRFDRLDVVISAEEKGVVLPIYISNKVLERDGVSLKVGEFIRGRCWMQGYLSHV